MADRFGSSSDVQEVQAGPASRFGSQNDSAEGHTVLGDVGDTLKQYWDKINPVTAAQGLVNAAQHPGLAANSYGDQNQKLFDKAKEAFRGGNYSEGVRHALSYFLNGVPGLGSALDEAGNKAGSGDIKGAIADTAALATQIAGAKLGPKVLDAATEPGAVGDAVNAAVQPVKNAAAAVKDYAAEHPAVAKTAGGVVGGAIGHATPIPGAGVMGAVMGREAVKDWLAEQAAKSAPAAAVEPVAAATVEAPAAAPVAAAADLDEIARSLGGKSFAKIGPAAQETVKMLAEKMKAQSAQVVQMPSPVNTAAVPVQAPAEAAHPPFAPDQPFSPSRAARQQTGAGTMAENAPVQITDQIAKLKRAFPWESDQQIAQRIQALKPVNPKVAELSRKLIEEMAKGK